MYCANCFSEITDDGFVECVDTGVVMHEECANHCIECGLPLSDQHSIKNKFICNSCSNEKNIKIDAIRRSHIEDYKTCPYRFKLQTIDGITAESNAYAQNGILLHDLFEKQANQEEYFIDDMKKEYLEKFETGVTNFRDWEVEANLPKREREKGLKCIDAYYEYISTAPKPLDTEVKIQFELFEDTPKVQCTFDRIEEVDGKLYLKDYKTGKVHVGRKLSNDLQIPLYIMAIQAHYGRLPESFQLLFLSENKERTYNKISDDVYICTVGKREYSISLEETKKELARIFSKIQKGLFQIPTDTLNKWNCENRCAMYPEYCAGVEDEYWTRGDK